MILITGAGGKTGKAIVEALSTQAEPVRVWVRRPEQMEGLKSAFLLYNRPQRMNARRPKGVPDAPPA